jgi:hypothetical protein
MSFAEARNQPNLVPEIKLVDFEERPMCQSCKNLMIICSHSTPSPVIGFEGTYSTKYREYTCGDQDCPQYRTKKFRAPNPWRVDRHKCDLEVETMVVSQRFNEKKTYQEIQNTLELIHGIEISDKTVGNIIARYEVGCKTEKKEEVFTAFKKNGGVFIGIDAMAPLKAEDKHIVAMDHFTEHTLLVERVQSENTDTHEAFQRNLKKIMDQNKIKVLGFMSDDHVAQRKAIRSVWGVQMKHCRCRFHFEKRILQEPFNLNRRLKTKARSRIRKLVYVKQYRAGNLKPIEHSTVWTYLFEAIKDLVALQTWKNKRNDTNLESSLFYERLQDIYHLLINLKGKITSLPKAKYQRENQRLEILLNHVEAILHDYKQVYEDLMRIKEYQEKVKEILDAHEEPGKVGLKKLTKLAGILALHLSSGKVRCDAEKDYIEKLCSFVFDRGESLFQYRDITNADNTNNVQETKFKTMKHTLKRTQGAASASQYLQGHAKYMLFVDPNASPEKIRQILMHADYKAIAKILKEDRAQRRRPLARIKNQKRWDSRKKSFKKKLQQL